MGSYCNESYAEFLDSLKAAGVVIRNEVEVRERLAESQRWRSAFMTLAANGRTLGIEFTVAGNGSDPRAVQRVLAEHAFPAEKEAAFIAQLTADCHPAHRRRHRCSMQALPPPGEGFFLVHRAFPGMASWAHKQKARSSPGLALAVVRA